MVYKLRIFYFFIFFIKVKSDINSYEEDDFDVEADSNLKYPSDNYYTEDNVSKTNLPNNNTISNKDLDYVNNVFLSDGIENSVQYIHNFNPDKSQNPFAYFTQIIHYAFLRRIQKEKRQLEIKNKILERSGFSEVFDDNLLDGSNYSDYNTIKDVVHSKLRY